MKFLAGLWGFWVWYRLFIQHMQLEGDTMSLPKTEEGKIRIVIADDHAIVSSGVRQQARKYLLISNTFQVPNCYSPDYHSSGSIRYRKSKANTSSLKQEA